MNAAASLPRGRMARDRVVPPTGFTAWLTVAGSAAMSFLAVFALALAVSAGRLADRWERELSDTATIRISAPEGQVETQTQAVLRVLSQTPGIADFRRLTRDDQAALLSPWFGPDLPVDALPLPELIELTEAAPGYDGEGLRLRLAAEAPGAVLDDHTRWRRPLVQAAGRLRAVGMASALLIGLVTAAIVALAAQAAMAANLPVVRTLRLVGATDGFIASAFVRRFTMRAAIGGVAGTAVGAMLLLILPAAGDTGFLTGLGFSGAGWLWAVAIPVLATLAAFAATWLTARRMLRSVP